MHLGTPENPLRIAIIGSGPSGFYAADYLLNQTPYTVEVDMFDRLPTPFGLVRGGVAPDHQKIKSVTKVYDKIAGHKGFKFYGNVTFGADLTLEDIECHYHAVVFAVGAQTDKNLGIAGEHLAGSHAATEFVGWYNGHPDYTGFQFDLTQETAIVVGVGNVAMDVARILARNEHELGQTDIADYALEALKNSNVKTIYILGRRGPAQAAFTPPEIKELGEIEGADLIIDPAEMELDEHSRAWLESPDADPQAVKNVATMRQYAGRTPEGKPRKLIMRFAVSPVELIGTERVEAVKIVKNTLVKRDDGSIAAKATDESEIIPAGLVFRSVGYRGVALPGVPFHEKWGVIPNVEGRVQDDERIVPGMYCVGWIKRGPSGIIGTNKPDSIETAKHIIEDYETANLMMPAAPAREAVEALLKSRGTMYTDYQDWQALDEIERTRGAALNRPRVKFTAVQEMLEALKAYREAQRSGE